MDVMDDKSTVPERASETSESADLNSTKMPIDPVDALFIGVQSSLVRGLLVCFAALLAFLLHFLANSGDGTPFLFPFACVFSVFLWAEHGMWFFAGFGAVLAAFYFGYKFTLVGGGKATWFALVLCFGFYFLPMNFTRVSNPGIWFGPYEPTIARDWIGSIATFFTFSIVFWFAAGWLQRIFAMLKPRHTPKQH